MQIAYKDIIKTTTDLPVKLHYRQRNIVDPPEVHPLDYDSKRIILPEGTLLLVRSYDIYETVSFALHEKDKVSVFEMEFLFDECENPYYKGFSIEVETKRLDGNFAILKIGDRSNLDLNKAGDAGYFVRLCFENKQHTHLLPTQLKNAFEKLFEEYDMGMITEGEVFNSCLERLLGYGELRVKVE